MKSKFLFLSLVILACSCSKKELPVSQTDTICLTVSADDSKTYVSGLKVLWKSTDKIIVNNNESTSTKVKSDGRIADIVVPSTTAPLYVFYPSSAFVAGSVAPSSSSYGKMVFPATQNYVDGSFDAAAAFMTGYSTSLTAPIAMKHAVAYLKITLSSSHSHAIKKLELSSIGGEDMSGTLKYSPSKKTLDGETSKGLKTSLVCSAGIPLKKALYIAIPAKTYKQGIQIRIIDVKNHYQDVKSAKSFTASPGTVYPSNITFVPTGTLVESDIETVEKDCEVTPYYKLNSAGHTPSSHNGQMARSTLTPIGGTYKSLYKDAMGTDMPIFPSFVKSGDGYMMFYHKGYYFESSKIEQWAGFRCAWAKSPDGINWTYKGELFPARYDVPGHYDNTITVYYSGPYGVRLANGDILVASAYRGSDDMRHKLLDNGIAVKISSDEGVSWSEETLINVGTCWEPHVLVLDSYTDHPGRIIIYYTDSRPYYENIWSNAVISTGVSYIYSDDNGQTWLPKDPLNNHLFAYRKYRGSKYSSGTLHNVYSDQMPSVIQLCGRKKLAGCGESNYQTIGYTVNNYWVDFAYTDANGDWGTPDAQGQMPSDREDKQWQGAGSSLCQFTSGETFHVSSHMNVNSMRQGDNNARNWGTATKLFDQSPSYANMGFWGRLFCDNHVMIAGLGGIGGSQGVGYPMQVGQFYLNHNLSASHRAINVNGENDDWDAGDEALMLGSNGNMHGTARFCVNSKILYILVEIENSSLSADDYFRVYISKSSASTVANGDVFLQVKPNGGLSQQTISSSAWVAADLGAATKITKGKTCYFAEISVPLSSLPVANNSLLINLSAGDAVDGNQSMLPSGTDVSTAKWPKLTL